MGMVGTVRSAKRIRVVVLDDRPLARAALREALTRDPLVEVVSAAPFDREGEAIALRACPDVVVVGLHSAGIDSVRLSELLHKRCGASGVLLLAESVDPDHVVRAMEAGVEGYLLMDISPNDLIRAVRELVEGASPLHPSVARVVVDQAALASGHMARAGLRDRGLTDREIDVLGLVARGLRDRDIGGHLFVSRATVKTHLRSIFRKLKVQTRVQAAAIAIRHRLIT